VAGGVFYYTWPKSMAEKIIYFGQKWTGFKNFVKVL
jgi:hypothetical protein